MYRPYGLHGGGDAQSGRNLWIKQPRIEDGDYPTGKKAPVPRTINLGGKATVKMGRGDRIGESLVRMGERRGLMRESSDLYAGRGGVGRGWRGEEGGGGEGGAWEG